LIRSAEPGRRPREASAGLGRSQRLRRAGFRGGRRGRRSCWLGSSGGGGEYGEVTGFGWTNGVVLTFLDEFGMEISSFSSAGGVRFSVLFLIPILATRRWVCDSD